MEDLYMKQTIVGVLFLLVTIYTALVFVQSGQTPSFFWSGVMVIFIGVGLAHIAPSVERIDHIPRKLNLQTCLTGPTAAAAGTAALCVLMFMIFVIIPYVATYTLWKLILFSIVCATTALMWMHVVSPLYLIHLQDE